MAETNLAQNPTFALGTAIEVRRNFAIDPGPTASPSGRWTFSPAPGEAVTSAWVSTPGAGPQGRTGYMRHTVTTAKTSGTGGPRYASQAADMSGLNGQARVVSAWVRFSHATTATLQADLRSVATSTLRGAADSPATAVAANTWVRLAAVVYSTGAYDGAAALVKTAASPTFPIAGWYDMANVMVEDTEDVNLTYLDHTYSADVDLIPSSVGAVNASATIVSAVRPTGVSFGGIRSVQWAAHGTTSLRVDAGTAGISGVWSAPVQITARSAGQSATFGSVTKTSTMPGEVLLWTTGSGSLSLGAGYWDKLGIGVTEWFSGDSTSGRDWTYGWVGTPNASNSTKTPTPGLYVTAQDGDPTVAPRTAVTITGLYSFGPSRVTLYRSSDGNPRRKVRGVNGALMYGSGFMIDYEAPLGRVVTYELVIDSGDVIPLRLTDTVTLDAETGFIQDPLQPGSAIPLTASDAAPDGAVVVSSKAFRKLGYAIESSSVNVLGGREPIAMTGQRMAASGIDFSLLTEAAEQSTALRNLFAQAPIVLVRPLPSWGPLPDVIYTVPSVTEEPTYGDEGVVMTTWSLVGDSVRAPTMNVLVPLWTYDAVQALWVTYADQQAQASAETARYIDVQADPTIGA